MWLLVLWGIATLIWRRRSQLISVRGMGIRADIGRLHDLPRVRVDDLTMTGSDITRLSLIATTARDEQTPDGGLTEGVFLIALNERDPGFAILREWLEHQSVLGIVMPPDSSIIRLRSLEDLQPLTLRRVDN